MKKYRVKEGYIYAYKSIFGEEIAVEFYENGGAHTALTQLGCMHWAEDITVEDPIMEKLNELPYPYLGKAIANREAALKNYPDYYPPVNVKEIHQAIRLAFDWTDSLEGYVYWKDLYELYHKQDK